MCVCGHMDMLCVKEPNQTTASPYPSVMGRKPWCCAHPVGGDRSPTNPHLHLPPTQTSTSPQAHWITLSLSYPLQRQTGVQAGAIEAQFLYYLNSTPLKKSVPVHHSLHCIMYWQRDFDYIRDSLALQSTYFYKLRWLWNPVRTFPHTVCSPADW